MTAIAVMLMILAVCAPRVASAGGPACPGDCSGDGAVAINELLVGVNIALSRTPVSMCPAFDQDGSETVSIGELIRAVNVALSGNCGTSVTPTPTVVVTDPTFTPGQATQTPSTPAPATSTPTATEGFAPTRTATPVPTIVTLYIGSASGQPGSSVTVDVTLATAGQSVAGTQNDIEFDARARVASTGQGVPNCSTTVEDRTVRTGFLPVGCDPATTCQRARVIVLDLAGLDPLPDGEVLYSCEVRIAAGAGTADASLGCANPLSGSTVPITRLTTGCVGGEVTIGSQGSAGLPSTVSPRGEVSDVCWGDCRGLGYPAFADFVSVVGIALGAPIATCPQADTEADLVVDLFDVLRVTQALLFGCRGEAP